MPRTEQKSARPETLLIRHAVATLRAFCVGVHTPLTRGGIQSHIDAERPYRIEFPHSLLIVFATLPVRRDCARRPSTVNSVYPRSSDKLVHPESRIDGATGRARGAVTADDQNRHAGQGDVRGRG